MEKKICKKCNNEKELKEFYFIKKNKIHYATCKNCQKIKREKYREKNREKIKSYKQKYDKNNKDKNKLTAQKYYENNSRNLINYSKKYYKKNKDTVKEYKKKYEKGNRKKINEYQRQHSKERKKKDPLYKLSTHLRTIISRLLKGQKNKHTEEILGCSFEEFKQHIEKQFESWMNWDNNGVYSPGKQVWHLDHKVPIASAKTIEELYKLNHYTNFQPLEALENIIKGDSLNLLEVVQN